MTSQADNLLNTLSANEISAYAADASTEEHIVVDTDRVITVPDSLKRIAVQYDHHVETVTFDCPRYWDEHDFSKMVVYINYRTPDGELGSYIADNVRVSDTDENIINFEWLITEQITYKAGKLVFIICIKDLENHWNSELCTSMYVSEGLEAPEDTNFGNPDILTQLLILYSETIELNKATMTRSGVYLGSGEMPDWANVQINPEGDGIYVLSDEEMDHIANLVLQNLPDRGAVVVDDKISETSTNPVQNKIIKAYVDGLFGDVESAVAEINTLIGGN